MSELVKKSVVVPVDFSRFSIPAIQAGLAYVARPQDLHVVHVLSELKSGDIWHDPNASVNVETAENRLKAYLDEHGVTGVSAAVRSGDAGSEIVAFAESVRAELIVIPSHGLHGLPRLLVGSVAERVVRLAHCPVLVLRDGSMRAS